MDLKALRSSGMMSFGLIWFSQVISVLGTGMTRFALAIWAWNLTGSATALGLILAFSFGAVVIVSPFAGALVDRLSRRWILITCEAVLLLSIVMVFGIYSMEALQVWHLYVVGVISGLAEAFQVPALMASITLMVPKEQYGRANGMTSLVNAISETIAPIVAGILVGAVGVRGVLAVDILSFGVALLVLLVVRIPQPTVQTDQKRRSLLGDALLGFQYIWARSALLGLLVIAALGNILILSFVNLIRPMVLARTADDAVLLGQVLSAAGLGGLVGALLMTLFGGPKRRVYGWLGGLFIQMAGMLLVGLGKTPVAWTAAAFVVGFAFPPLAASNLAIWQAKVSPELQGRVFSARRLIIQITIPISTLLIGLLADHVFEPAMRADGAVSTLWGELVGTGPGAGMSLIMVLAGALGVLMVLVGYLSPGIRHIESTVPDYHPVAAKT